MLIPTFSTCAAAEQAQDAIAADCDGPAWQRVLQPAPAGSTAMPAEAHWLDATSIQWPGIATAQKGAYRLLASRHGQLRVELGEPPSGMESSVLLQVQDTPLRREVAERFRHLAEGLRFQVDPADQSRVPELLRQQLVLVRQNEAGRVVQATQLQLPAALDSLYPAATAVADLGVTLAKGSGSARFALWAPTASRVSVCHYANGSGPATSHSPMTPDPATGVWRSVAPGPVNGSYYTYLVDVWVNGTGLVRNRVTDPYSVSLTTDSRRSFAADLNDPKLKPVGWEKSAAARSVKAATDMSIYELHVRDFSIGDDSVPAAHRGKYLAFTDANSRGMRHLRALAQAGLTDLHLLPVFDIATIPEQGCIRAVIPRAAPDSEAQQASSMADAAKDCFNWGYDPFHYSVPEGSYATDPANGAARVLEFRRMVQALHRTGLRVGMDVVYNHTSSSGQHETSVLDRIVPGYYHRLNARGQVERSTCCDNTATEHAMMAKLMSDSVLLWASQYHIDSFRFDLMAHQPRDVMLAMRERVSRAVGRDVQVIGEGWNFGEVADGARFVQASQLMLNGSGIATFSDRGRDAVRGGSAGDGGEYLVKNQGYVNGLIYAPNHLADPKRPAADLLKSADLVRVGLAGSVRDYRMTNFLGQEVSLHQVDYGGQPAGYVSQPGEVVNYVENHDNQTLFDINAYRLPQETSRRDRVYVQMLGVALNAFSQGVAYFHAGVDTLRSKSLDGNSFDSGDWFNRLDWSYRDNGFAAGLPPAGDNRGNYPWMKPLLARADIKPTHEDILLARDMFRDLLRMRASSSLFRLRSAADIAQRLKFYNTGPSQNPVLQVGHLNGVGYPGARFKELIYLVNVSPQSQTLTLADQRKKPYVLHPVLRRGADKRLALQAHYHSASGQFSLPARSAVVFVVQ